MLGQLFKTFSNCWRIPELRSRIIFTALILAVARLIAVTPVPGLDGAALSKFADEQAQKGGGGPGSVVAIYSLFTGGALEKCAVGSLGIMPYISASIIIQLLTAVVPMLGKLAREEGGRVKLIAYGRYLTVLLCLGWATATAVSWEHPDSVFHGFQGKLISIENIWVYRLETVVVLTTGTLLLMWLGEQITERGVGNGVSLVITVGILARLPLALKSLVALFHPPDGVDTAVRWPHAFVLVALLIAVIAGVIAITQAQRKIPVQYAQRAVGRKVVSGGTSYMPLKVNYPGVMPVIFAQSILIFPGMLFERLHAILKPGMFRDIVYFFLSHFSRDGAVYLISYTLMILFFSYFWVATQFNELQIADDIKRQGGYIPGVRPGSATSDFLHRAMTRITLAGAVFLAVIAIIPILMSRWLSIDQNVAQFFGGTSILITVGVLLDTMRQMESYLHMRNYDGFLKKGRVKGRF